MKFIFLFFNLFIFLLILLPGCNQKSHLSHEEISFVHKIQNIKKDQSQHGLTSLSHLKDVPFIKVLGTPNDSIPFYVEKRTNQISQFPCLNCHQGSLDQLKMKLGKKKSHWNIELIHASQKTIKGGSPQSPSVGPGFVNCVTCHNPRNLDSLVSLNQKKISFNHSYQLCSQCHSRQFKDWIGGAHGKRLGGWAPPRVVKNCTSCHNPHNPKMEKRWPAIAH